MLETPVRVCAGKDVDAMGIGRYTLMVRRTGKRGYAEAGALDTLPLQAGSEVTVALGHDTVRIRIDRTESGVAQPVLYASEV